VRWLGCLALIVEGHALACVCAGWPSAKQAWEGSPVVFLGYVERADPNPDSLQSMIGEQTVSVRVDEPFKGVHAEQTLVLAQEGNDCSPKFKEGERALFYLHSGGSKDVWEAPGCHRTRSLEYAADDLLFLRALPASARKNRFSGEIDLYENSAAVGFRRSRPLPGIRVTLSSGNRTIETISNADGVYELYDLPPSKYSVAIEVPETMKIQFPIIFGAGVSRDRIRDLSSKSPQIDLGSASGVGVDFVLFFNNQMSGRVLGPEGKPMQDVCLDLEPASEQAGRNFHVFDCTKSDGSYKMEDMSAGQYVIIANNRGRISASAPFPKLFYPGTTNREQAEVVTIGNGEHLKDLDMHVPALEKRVKISGRLQFIDGTPVSDQYVIFESRDPGYTERASTTKDGSFDLAIISGRPGELHGEMTVFQGEAAKCPQFNSAIRPGALLGKLSTAPSVVSGDSDQREVVLVIPARSCKHWPDKR
jgi:hypothetical protein